MQTSSITHIIARVEVLRNDGLLFRAARIELHHARGIGDGLHAGQASTTPNKPFPVLVTILPLVARKLMYRGAQMRQAKKAEQHDHDHRWNRNQKRQSTGVLWTEIIQGPDHENCDRRRTFPDVATPRYWKADRALMAAVTM